MTTGYCIQLTDEREMHSRLKLHAFSGHSFRHNVHEDKVSHADDTGEEVLQLIIANRIDVRSLTEG